MLFQVFIRSVLPFAILMSIAAFLYYDGQLESAQGTFTAGIIFTIVSGASVIYDLNHWSIVKRSVVHFLVMLVTIYPILLMSGWFELNSVMDYAVVLIVFICTGIVLWVLMLLVVTLISKFKNKNED
ncbi:DUF3021 family protein [Corticicoccus populi]|uniref:DUF3021 family protein n=1 Tax=Corticicoccus populi TaxID=1812821 RepID=A0ABW5WW14_9STAP